MCRSVVVVVAATLGSIAGCGDDIAPPCTVVEDDGVVTLMCPDRTVDWRVPVCGNDLVEAGEACDDASPACTSDCAIRPGWSCTAGGAVCVCDPAIVPAVRTVDTAVFYGMWIDLDETPATGHQFSGAGSDPGPEFATRGDVAFACDLGTSAPSLIIPALRRHALVATPVAAVSPEQVATITSTVSSIPSILRPAEWVGRSLLVVTETGAVFGLEVPFYETPCLGTADDDQLLIQYSARELRCPR